MFSLLYFFHEAPLLPTYFPGCGKEEDMGYVNFILPFMFVE